MQEDLNQQINLEFITQEDLKQQKTIRILYARRPEIGMYNKSRKQLILSRNASNCSNVRKRIKSLTIPLVCIIILNLH